MVKKLDLSNVKASGGDGGFTPLPEGAYVVEIVAVMDNEEREYLEVTFDVAEGEYAGYYSDEWGVAHPYAHQIKVSYKEKALGMLKGWLDALTASNPGFDAEACFNGIVDACERATEAHRLASEAAARAARANLNAAPDAQLFAAEACDAEAHAATSDAMLVTMWGMFQGRKFGLAVLNEYEDWQSRPLNNPRLDWSNAKRLTAQAVREGTFTWQKRDERHTPKERPAQVQSVGDADIPF